jgi:hypothetical protein
MIITQNIKLPFKPRRKFFDKLFNPETTATIYGNQKWIRKIALYPRFLPLCIKTDHSPGIPFDITKDIHTNARYMFFQSEKYIKEIKKKPVKTSIKLYTNPLCFYYDNYYKQSDNLIKKGSLYFYAHGNNEVKPTKNINDVIIDLNNLDQKYQPITICLHYQDLINNVHLDFLNSFKVVCIGNPNDWDYIENFVREVKKYKYTFSSNFSSYSLYSIYLGIPFSLIGTESKFINNGDNLIPQGVYESMNPDSDYAKYIKKNFVINKINENISNEDLTFVNEYLGITSNFKRINFIFYVYYSFIFSLFRFKFYKKYIQYLIKSI